MLNTPSVRATLRAALVVIYTVAGGFHLARPDVFLLITPDWVPAPRAVIFVTGVCELFGAAGLLVTRVRWLAGIALAAYAICVFPANLKHALYGVASGQVHLTWWYHAPRLAMQPVLIWAALFSGNVLDWPFGRRPNVDAV